MHKHQTIAQKTYQLFSNSTIDKIQKFNSIDNHLVQMIKMVASVLPFRVNNYIIDELIDWGNIPDDPIFKLTFPQPGMLKWDDLERLKRLVQKNAPPKERMALSRKIQMEMNPHPAGQIELNMPHEMGKLYKGMQHKYDETVLFFPNQGQTCHAYCTYCFRWAQFVGLEDLKFAANDPRLLIEYIDRHPEITDLLITGGDPLVMRTNLIRKYLEPILAEMPGSLSTIRIGTKVPAYWPYRFVTDKDADDLLRLFEEIVQKGLHLSIMAHFSHHRELETPIAQTAIKRVITTGAAIRAQAPLIRHINDAPDIWARMWQHQVKLGVIPYYMFVERDTGPKRYFRLPLYKAYQIFTEAYQHVSGLCRTVRGPSMSATPGKILLDGMTRINGQEVFVLKFIQARDAAWVNQVFFAEYDENACWLDDLKPAFGKDQFFFEDKLETIKREREIPYDMALMQC